MRAVLCATCERPRLAAAAPEVAAPVPTSPSAGEPAPPVTVLQNARVTPPLTGSRVLGSSEWRCKSCTVANAGSSILCEVCERPRLATRPPAAALAPPGPGAPAEPGAQVCDLCAT